MPKEFAQIASAWRICLSQYLSLFNSLIKNARKISARQFEEKFYDRYLEQHPVFYKAAVAFSFQIVDHIETESYDLKPDCIITEQAVL